MFDRIDQQDDRIDKVEQEQASLNGFIKRRDWHRTTIYILLVALGAVAPYVFHYIKAIL